MTAQVLAALFGGAAAGAVLNHLFGLVTGWLDRRHEHRRWLLDKRVEAYVSYNEAWNLYLKRVQAVAKGTDRQSERLDESLRGLADATLRLGLIAPEDTDRAADRLLGRAHEAGEAVVDARKRLQGRREIEAMAAIESVRFEHGLLYDLQRRDVQGPERPHTLWRELRNRRSR